MRKWIFWGQLLLFGVAFLVGCSNETNVTSHTTGDRYNGRIIGMIHGIITARDTNTPMANVTVEYAVHGGTRQARSDANGYYRTENLDEGTYTIGFFSPDTGYADWREVVEIRLDTSKLRPSDEDYRVVMSYDVPMYRRNAGIQGYVYARVGNETLVPAAGVEVRATGFGNVILSADYVARADSNGYYVFSSLPATPTAVVIAMPWTNNGVTYGIGTTPTPVELVGGGIAVAENIVVVPATAGIIVIGNNFGDGDFPVDGTINLVFSRPIDGDSLFIYLRRQGVDVPVVHTLDASGVNLSIDPIVILRASTDYELTVDGRGADYTGFSYTAWIKTELGIKLESTTLWQIDGQNREDVGLTEALGFTFTQPVDVTNPDNEVWIRRGFDILVGASYSNQNKTLTVTPVGSFLPETWYRVHFTVYSTLPEDYTAWDFDFRTISDAVAPGQVSGLQCDTLNYIDWDWKDIPLSWNVAQNATGYRIYAYDSYRVTDRVVVGTVQSGAPYGRVGTTINLRLHPEFDWLPGDGIQTPFSNGIIVRFIVRATNDVGEGPLSPEVAVRDVKAPRASDITLSQDSTCNNNRQVSKTVWIRMTSPTEYCNTNVSAQWRFEEAGGNPNYLLPHGAARWEWDAGMRTGSLIITVPAQSNGAGDRLQLWGISDNSANVMSDTVRVTLF